ncbi:hypothetical protein AOLI_G00006650 [Acnodon oligacanthus]
MCPTCQSWRRSRSSRRISQSGLSGRRLCESPRDSQPSHSSHSSRGEQSSLRGLIAAAPPSGLSLSEELTGSQSLTFFCRHATVNWLTR